MPLMLPPSSPALRPFVDALWYADEDVPHRWERKLPSGTAQLIVNLDADVLSRADAGGVHTVGGAALAGPSAGPAVIDTAEQRLAIGVSFRAGGTRPFLLAPASETRDDVVELGELWGRDGDVLRDRLLSAPTPQARLWRLEAALLARAVRPLEPDRALTAVIGDLDRGAPVATVADRVGQTRKTLAGRFSTVVGLTPKRFARVRRFQRLLAAIGARADVDWARLAVECRYYDQAHLIRDFRAFADGCPTAYQPRSATDRNHQPLQG